jgi:hypothetical protein
MKSGLNIQSRKKIKDAPQFYRAGQDGPLDREQRSRSPARIGARDPRRIRRWLTAPPLLDRSWNTTIATCKHVKQISLLPLAAWLHIWVGIPTGVCKYVRIIDTLQLASICMYAGRIRTPYAVQDRSRVGLDPSKRKRRATQPRSTRTVVAVLY